MKKDIIKKIYETLMIIVIFISVIPLIKPIYAGSPLDIITYLILVFDYVIRLIISPKKKIFFKENLFDLVAIMPFANYFRLARLVRVFKIFKVNKIISGRIINNITEVMRIHGLDKTLYSVMFITIIAGALINWTDPNFTTYDDAFWWVIVTITTVGYGDYYPISGFGRFIAILLMFFGIGIMGLFTSSLISTFSKDDEQLKEKHNLSKIKDKKIKTKIKYINSQLCKYESLNKSDLLELSNMIKNLK